MVLCLLADCRSVLQKLEDLLDSDELAEFLTSKTRNNVNVLMAREADVLNAIFGVIKQQANASNIVFDLLGHGTTGFVVASANGVNALVAAAKNSPNAVVSILDAMQSLTEGQRTSIWQATCEYLDRHNTPVEVLNMIKSIPQEARSQHEAYIKRMLVSCLMPGKSMNALIVAAEDSVESVQAILEVMPFITADRQRLLWQQTRMYFQQHHNTEAILRMVQAAGSPLQGKTKSHLGMMLLELQGDMCFDAGLEWSWLCERNAVVACIKDLHTWPEAERKALLGAYLGLFSLQNKETVIRVAFDHFDDGDSCLLLPIDYAEDFFTSQNIEGDTPIRRALKQASKTKLTLLLEKLAQLPQVERGNIFLNVVNAGQNSDFLYACQHDLDAVPRLLAFLERLTAEHQKHILTQKTQNESTALFMLEDCSVFLDRLQSLLSVDELADFLKVKNIHRENALMTSNQAIGSD